MRSLPEIRAIFQRDTRLFEKISVGARRGTFAGAAHTTFVVGQGAPGGPGWS